MPTTRRPDLFTDFLRPMVLAQQAVYLGTPPIPRAPEPMAPRSYGVPLPGDPLPRFRWDGRELLTVDGELNFRVYLYTRPALADMLLRLADPDEAHGPEEVAAFADAVLRRLEPGAFVMRADAIHGWRRAYRQAKKENM